MENRNWVFGLIVLIIILGLSTWGFSKNVKDPGKNIAGVSEPTVKVSDTSFFDENASIMLFYSDSCGWCNKQKEVLSQLAPEGYRVKPMDVAKNPDYWKQYNVSGTPTFIAANGQRQEGYLEKDALKAWLDANK